MDDDLERAIRCVSDVIASPKNPNAGHLQQTTDQQISRIRLLLEKCRRGWSQQAQITPAHPGSSDGASTRTKFRVDGRDGGSCVVELDKYGFWLHLETGNTQYLGPRFSGQHDRRPAWSDTNPSEWDEVYSSQRVRAFNIDRDTTIINVHSDKGTGKSHQMVSLLNVVLNQISRPHDMPKEVYDELRTRFPDSTKTRVVLVSTRKTYSADMQRRLDGLGFQSYLIDPSSRLLVCQVESLHKVKQPADIVFLDESESVCNQIVSGLNNTHIHENTQTFKSLFQAAKLKICLDADLGRRTIDVCQALMTVRDHMVCFMNTHRSTQREILIHTTRESIMDTLKRALEEGKKIYVVLGTVDDGRRIEQVISTYFPTINYRFYHSDADARVLDDFRQIDSV